MADTLVSEAYAARAAEYTGLFGSIEAAAEQDRQLLLGWAQGVDGQIIDIGCGPGQWTNYLHGRGVDIVGVDPVRELISEARLRFPGVDYRVGHAGQLDAEDASLGGVLAWYSLIHLEPGRVDAVLIELARCVRPGGSLVIGFFEGAELAPFDHAVTPAYFWPVGLLSHRVERAGFAVADVRTRTEPGMRPQGAIIALRGA